jgi:carbon monoxide dehydrogenase subunit G
MQMEGDRDFAQPPAELWPKLTDASFLASCLEGVQVDRSESAVAAWHMRPTLAFMTGSIEVTLTILDLVPQTEMKASVFSKGIGATSTVLTRLTFMPRDGGTRIHWKAEVTQLTGLLKLIPPGLIQAAAQKVVEDVWGQIFRKLGRG